MNRRHGIRLALLVAVGSITIASTADAQDDAFKKGIAARKDQNWRDAAAAMRGAIGVDPKESTRKVGRVLGVGGEEYLPYFFLGEALFRQGDCTGALATWEESDRQGVARTVGDNARIIGRGYADCEAKGFLPPPRFAKELQDARAVVRAATDVSQRLAQHVASHPEARVDTGPAEKAQALLAAANERLTTGERTRRAQDLADARSMADAAAKQFQASRQLVDAAIVGAEAFTRAFKEVEAQLQSAENAVREIEQMLTSSPVKVSVPEAIGTDRTRANGSLANAREKLRTARTSQLESEVADAGRSVQDGATLLGRVRSQLEALISAGVSTELTAIERSGGDAFQRIETQALAVEDSLKRHPEAADIAAEFAKFQTTFTRSRRGFDRAIRARDLPAARTAAQASSQLLPQLDSLAARLGIATLPVLPEVLRRAAEALFDGRYSDVLTTMTVEATGSIEMPLRVQAHVIRAAALFALYEYSGATDDKLRAQARQEADTCRALDATFRPSADAFSPRFIQFFLAARNAAS